MRLLISIFVCSCALQAQKFGYALSSQDAGPWDEILSSIGLLPKPVPDASVFVARPGTAASTGWLQAVEGGDFLILEGDSALARSFGISIAGPNYTAGDRNRLAPARVTADSGACH